MTALLSAEGVTVSYGGVPAIRDVSVSVAAGEVVSILGPNGAGKTTTLLALAGELPLDGGGVVWNGSHRRTPLHKRARGGLAFVADDRSVFMDLTARDNLRVGRCSVSKALAFAPELEAHLDRRAGLLSGGQQQLLTLARALGREPVVLLADEPSLGLAPKIVDRLLQTVRAAADRGIGVVLVEQHVRKALKVSDRVCVLQNGAVAFQGSAADARDQAAEIEAGYFAPTRPGPD
jgi:sulfate-transporting ATPase